MASLTQRDEDLIHVDPSFLTKWNLSVPRYTSYPTAPQFSSMKEETYIEKLKEFDQTAKPLSLYLHIPFCRSMCLFCGCSVILNRNPERQSRYLSYLYKEISLLPFSQKREVTQLHIGGGTPTSLSEEEFDELVDLLQRRFFWNEGAEISIEIDPRTVFADRGRKLRHLKALGFNRVSFGVQDLDAKVQEAVKRRQTEEMTFTTFRLAREIGFQGINLDLIYGLPCQTRASFLNTAQKIAELRPDRIAFFSYAKVPWLKKHQLAISEELLPSDQEKFTIYTDARAIWMQSGYQPIGMDHFSLPEDSLSIAYREKKIMRNFQGYSVCLSSDLIGLGITSIGCVEGTYVQNAKTMAEYEASLDRGALPASRGYVLKEKDRIVRDVIQKLMCHFEIDKREFFVLTQVPFNQYFSASREEIMRLVQEGLIEDFEDRLVATAMGRLMIRVIASVFDEYKTGNYSKAI